MSEWIRTLCARKMHLPRSARRTLFLTGILLLAIALVQSASPLAVPPDHSPAATHCTACHGPPPNGNEEDLDQEGLFLVDHQPPAKTLADGKGRISGYASDSSVRQGEVLHFYTSASLGVRTYDLVVFRAGQEIPVPILTVKDLPASTHSCSHPVGVEAGQEHLALGCNWPIAYILHHMSRA